eukprot:XP_017948710.1 PREDICTED: dedicator of cytokinesis protein 3-like [Xenopus tropicalis]
MRLNKEFVCRGHDYERLEAFQQRMLSEFPQAIAMQHLNHPDDTILQSDAQYLQIYAVTPLPDTPNILQMDQVPDRIKSFYRVNNVRRFRYDRPFHRGTRDKDNEFKHFPDCGALAFLVDKTNVFIIPYPEPTVTSADGNKVCSGRFIPLLLPIHLLSFSILFSFALFSLITIWQAFFDKEYITQHPEDAEKISQLKELMQEQVHVLGVGLAVHERCVHPEMRPLHKKLVDQFQVMRSSLYQEFPTMEKMNLSCPPLSRSNILLAHGPMSADSVRLLHRHSPLVVLNSVRHSSSSLSSHASSDTGTTPTAGDSENEDPYSMQMLLPHSLHAGSITNVSALSSSYTSPSSSSLSSTHSAPSQLVNSAPSSTRGSPSLPDKYRHSRDLVMLLPAPRDRPSSAMYQTSTDNGQRCMYPRALFQQVLGPCKPCSDPNLSVAEKVLTAPSSWSLDSGTRESLPFMASHIGSVLTPTGTTRGLTQGHYSLHFDAFHPAMGEGAPLPTRSLRKSPLHTIPASPTSPQSCLDGSNSPLSGSASSGVSSLSEGNLSGCPDPASATDPRTEENHTGGFQHYPPVRYSLSDPNGLEPPKFQGCRSHSAPSGVTPPRSPSGEQEEGGADQERTRRHRRNCTGEKEQPARVGWEHNMSKQ